MERPKDPNAATENLRDEESEISDLESESTDSMSESEISDLEPESTNKKQDSLEEIYARWQSQPRTEEQWEEMTQEIDDSKRVQKRDITYGRDIHKMAKPTTHRRTVGRNDPRNKTSDRKRIQKHNTIYLIGKHTEGKRTGQRKDKPITKNTNNHGKAITLLTENCKKYFNKS